MRFLAIFLALLLFSKCSSPEASTSSFKTWMEDDARLHVLSSTGIVGDLVDAIGRDLIAHITLIPASVDPHSYELVKGDDEKIQRANLIFYNGLGLEHGASLYYAFQKHPHAVPIGDKIFEKKGDKALYVNRIIDPHIWMDIEIWIEGIDVVVSALSNLDPEHRKIFEERGCLLKEEMKALDRRIYDQIQKIPEGQRYLVTSHDAFNYFARRYLATDQEKNDDSWKKRFQAPEGLAPDGQLGMRDIENIINHVELYQIRFLFPESNVSTDSLKKIHLVAEKRGLQIFFSKTPLYGDTLSGENEHVDSYQKMMEHNADVIANFLGSPS